MAKSQKGKNVKDMDIRKYFGIVPSKNKHEPEKKSSSHIGGRKGTDVNKNTSASSSKEKVGRKRSKRIIESDSDEDLTPKKVAKQEKVSIIDESDDEKVEKKSVSNIRKVVEKTPPKTKPTTPSEYFGILPVKRSLRLSPHRDKNGDNRADKRVQEEELDTHSDEDFLETLKSIDRKESVSNKLKVEENVPPRSSKSKEIPVKSKAPEKSTVRVEKTPPSTKSAEKVKAAQPSSASKKGNPTAYYQYLNREGPRAPGSKQIPQGAPDCLKGFTFVITGVLESLEREEASEIVRKYGGKVTQSISKNTTHLVAGRDSGPAKLEKAKKLGKKIIDEDGLLDLLRASNPNSNASSSSSKPSISPEKPMPLTEITPEKVVKPEDSSKSVPSLPVPNSPMEDSSCMWVDKYKPKSVKQIIGQQGDRSNVNKLKRWLEQWHKNNQGNVKKKAGFGKWGTTDDGSSFKAALLSGPPGVGKTTSAQLVCKETGFTYVELNASDTRSKKSLEALAAQMLQNKSLSHYIEGNPGSAAKHCLLMDEVDGMAGNEDRGGVQELIQLIKKSKIPIICMCNDRNHPKIRSLANYCFDLRFQRPRVEQITAAMMSICFKEALKIKADAIQEMVNAANHDIRQILHHLSVWTIKSKGLNREEATQEAKKAKKDLKLGPFDAIRLVFSASDHKTMSIHDKADLFFYDYSLGPLFVHENYLSVTPHLESNDQSIMDLMSKAADSICQGDLVEKLIRSEGNWSMLPVQAMYSSVIPGDVLSGHLSSRIQFPSWLGRNSNRNKNDRLLQELYLHTRLSTSGNKTDLNLDYLPHLKGAVFRPLLESQQQGIAETLSVLEMYYLTKDDLESVLELTSWSTDANPMAKLSTQLKTAFTRAYNKNVHKNPYSTIKAVPKKAVTTEEDGEDEGDEASSSDDDLTKDAMIKKKVASSKRASGTKATTSKRGKRS